MIFTSQGQNKRINTQYLAQQLSLVPWSLCQCLWLHSLIQIYGTDCCCSLTKLYLTLCNPKDCSTHDPLSFTISRSLLKLMPIESMMPSNHFILCHPFSSRPQSFPASRSFLMSRLFTSGGQTIVASVSASVLPKNIQGCFPLGLTGLISLLSKGLYETIKKSSILPSATT